MNTPDEVIMELTGGEQPPPFGPHEEFADLILHTKDDARLFVHKLILRRVSPMFATMFGLPQPNESGGRTPGTPIGSDTSGIPTVVVTEDKAVWDVILRILYHYDLPELKSTAELKAVLEAAHKYEMDCITARMRHLLLCPLHNGGWAALELYGLACAYGLEDVAQAAARATLRLSLHALCAHELRDVPAHTFQRLLAYRLRCQEAASGVASLAEPHAVAHPRSGGLRKELSWLPRMDFTFFTCTCGSGGSPAGNTAASRTIAVSVQGQGYWKEYMTRAEAALKNYPVGSMVQGRELMERTTRAANNCMNCRYHIVSDIAAFADYMAKEVDRAVSEVRTTYTAMPSRELTSFSVSRLHSNSHCSEYSHLSVMYRYHLVSRMLGQQAIGSMYYTHPRG